MISSNYTSKTPPGKTYGQSIKQLDDKRREIQKKARTVKQEDRKFSRLTMSRGEIWGKKKK